MPFVSSCQEGANREFECHCYEQAFNKEMCSVFKRLRFWCSHWKQIVSKTHRVQIYAFSLAFSKSSFFTAEQRECKAKRISFAQFSYENEAVWTGLWKSLDATFNNIKHSKWQIKKALLKLRLTLDDCFVTLGCSQIISSQLYCSLTAMKRIRLVSQTSGNRKDVSIRNMLRLHRKNNLVLS